MTVDIELQDLEMMRLQLFLGHKFKTFLNMYIYINICSIYINIYGIFYLTYQNRCALSRIVFCLSKRTTKYLSSP